MSSKYPDKIILPPVPQRGGWRQAAETANLIRSTAITVVVGGAFLLYSIRTFVDANGITVDTIQDRILKLLF